MKKNPNLSKTLALGSLILFALIVWACAPAANDTKPNANTATGGNNANTTATTGCDDKKVIQAIKDTIAKSYPELTNNIRHINAYSKGCSVALMGYTGTLQNFKDFYTVAANTPDVVGVNIESLFIDSKDVGAPIGGQCPAGQQACGDICVPQGQCWADVMPDPTPNANVNGNTNTKSNTNSGGNRNSPPKSGT